MTKPAQPRRRHKRPIKIGALKVWQIEALLLGLPVFFMVLSGICIRLLGVYTGLLATAIIWSAGELIVIGLLKREERYQERQP